MMQFWTYTKFTQIVSSLDVILCFTWHTQQSVENVIKNILLYVHNIQIMSNHVSFPIWKIPEYAPLLPASWELTNILIMFWCVFFIDSQISKLIQFIKKLMKTRWPELPKALKPTVHRPSHTFRVSNAKVGCMSLNVNHASESDGSIFSAMLCVPPHMPSCCLLSIQSL